MGNHLSIIDVIVPQEASYGEVVNAQVYVWNNHTERVFAVVTGKVDSTELYSSSHWVEPGAQRVFGLSFTMPNKAVDLWAWVYQWNWDTSDWEDSPDDAYGPVTINLTGSPGAYTGRIENPRIKWGSTAFPPSLYDPIPQTIPYGDYFRIGFTGRNTSDVNLKLWGSVKVYRPDGSLFYQAEDAESLYTGPNGTHNFEFPSPTGPAKQVDAYGEWKATLELRVGSASGELLDRESRITIFSTGDEPPPCGYAGEIRNPRVRECNGVWQSMDGAEPIILSGTTIQVYFDGRNLCGCMAEIHAWVTVKSPSGATVFDEFDDSTLIISDGADHHFTFPGTYTCSAQELNELGRYTVSVILKAEHDGLEEEVDRQDYYFKVSAEPGNGGDPSGKAEITAKAIDYELIGAGVPFPAAEPVPVPEHARISITAVTRSEERERLACEVWIYSPSSNTEAKYHFEDTSAWPCCDPDAAHEFIFPTPPNTFVIDELGQWNIKIHITDASDSELLAEYEGLFFNGEEAPESTWGMIGELMPLMMIMMMFAMIVPMMRDMAGELEEGYE